ncbi:MAG: transcriptional repressor [Betaproteobacteria bacterium]|jgi:Fur family ferric uptake transcriptional regulator|nr:transcriptional repressor [Betaproteobacteria bacterium]
MAKTMTDAAEAMIRESGARVTRARVEVLAVLLKAERALSHHDVERRLNRSLGVDRVTVYRVLDWLSGCGLAHKIAGEDRISRYNAAEHAHSRAHAHFQCGRCGTVVCLDDADAPTEVPVPTGFVPHEVVLTVKGLCATCAHTRTSSSRHPPARARH